MAPALVRKDRLIALTSATALLILPAAPLRFVMMAPILPSRRSRCLTNSHLSSTHQYQ